MHVRIIRCVPITKLVLRKVFVQAAKLCHWVQSHSSNENNITIQAK
jgi:hypothetical protein